jgi:hypothetical protein
MMQTLERAGVRPPAVHHAVAQVVPLDVPVVDVGDLELAARRRLEPLDDFEDARVVNVDAGHREAAPGLEGLLLDAGDAAVLEHRDAEALGIVNLGEQDARPPPGIPSHHRPDALLEDVVAENDAERLAVGEVLGQGERVRDPALALLVRVVDVVEAELAPVAQQPEEVARVVPAGDDEDVADAGVDQRLDRVVDHRPVVHREQVLVGDAGERREPAPEPAREYDAFHCSSPSSAPAPRGSAGAGKDWCRKSTARGKSRRHGRPRLGAARR